MSFCGVLLIRRERTQELPPTYLSIVLGSHGEPPFEIRITDIPANDLSRHLTNRCRSSVETWPMAIKV